jgi:RimJ/RimL family protein N-acetyltransferase
LEQDVIRLLQRFSPTGDLRLPVDLQEGVGELLGGAGPRPMETGPAFRFPDPIPGSGEAVQLTKANVEVAGSTFPWLLTELPDWWPCFAVVRDGIAVSICFSSRIGPRACEAGVDTLPAFRGRGFASAATAAWAASIQASGRIPLYSTSWDNLASRGVARHLGLIMFGADASWT